MRQDADWRRRFAIAEQIKVRLREKYYRAAYGGRVSYGTYVSRSRSFWGEYEEVNRIWLPDDPVYSGNINTTVHIAPGFLWSVVAPTNGAIRLLEHIFRQAPTSSVTFTTGGRVFIQRTNGDGIAPAPQTPEQFNSRSPVAASAFNLNYTTAVPTSAGNPLLIHATAAFDFFDRWVAAPEREIWSQNGEEIALYSFITNIIADSTIIWEEL